MSDPSQPPSDPYRPQPPYQPLPPYGQAPQPPMYPPPGGHPPPGYGGYYARPTPPQHPSATTAMVLGIVALAGGFMCLGLPFVVGPFAWAIGHRAVREIDASPTPMSGRGEALTGKICGIVATVFLVLGLVFVAVLIGLTINDPDIWDEDTSVLGLLG